MNILCVCTGNTCRSPMLATLIARAAVAAGRSDVQVASAGTGAADGESASDGARAAMARRGLDLALHRSRRLGPALLADVDLVLCMSSSHAAAVRAHGMPARAIQVVNAEGGGVPDPFGGDDDEYEACARVLEHAAGALVAALPR